MIRTLNRSIRFSYFSSPIPTSSHSSSALILHATFSDFTARISRRRRRKNNSPSPPPPDQSQIDASIASLPRRFTSSDLSSALARLPDPRLCIPLLLHSTHRRPQLVRSGDADASSLFLVAVNRLGSARLYRDMDSAAALAFSFSTSVSFPETFFNTLIRFYSEARWISKAIGVYKFMRHSRHAASRPTTRTFNLLFAALLGHHRGANSYIRHLYMDALRSLFRQMLASDLAPDLFAFNSMIKGYVLSLHLNDALRMFHQMVPVYGVSPDDDTYSYLIHGLCAQGRTRNARELYSEMRVKGLVPSGRACNSLISVLAMEGEVNEAVAALWEAVGMRKGPDFITSRTVVEEFCRQQRMVDAVEFIKEMRQKDVIDGHCFRELLAGVEGEYQN
ncbi:Pentatricopeptide repeat-containing protein [Platanthera zijinensis]|uniref:Pentatricopeptide repeat-containing protein n=1 Tax=Platanthera zijinensis TaxID=2320716 RepID=A0AAP0BAM2_9ASPA